MYFARPPTLHNCDTRHSFLQPRPSVRAATYFAMDTGTAANEECGLTTCKRPRANDDSEERLAERDDSKRAVPPSPSRHWNELKRAALASAARNFVSKATAGELRDLRLRIVVRTEQLEQVAKQRFSVGDSVSFVLRQGSGSSRSGTVVLVGTKHLVVVADDDRTGWRVLPSLVALRPHTAAVVGIVASNSTATLGE